MSLAPPPDADPEILAGIDRKVDNIVGGSEGKTLEELETMRQNYLFRLHIGFIVIAAATFIGILAILHINSEGIIKLLMFAWVAIIVVSLSPILTYKNKAREILMPVLVRLFGDLSWLPNAPKTGRFWQDFNACGLVGYYDSEDVTDLITGSMKGTHITLAEMTLTRGSGKSRTIVFEGAAIHIRLQKPAPFRLILKPRAIELHLFTAPDAPTEVGIPSPDFTRVFRAFSDDQVLARALLTPDVVEQLTRLNLLFGNRRLGASLRDDSLFLVAHGSGELAPESIFTSAYKLDRVHNVGRQLYLLSTLIETIMKDWQLNTATPYQAISTSSTPAQQTP